MAQAVAAKTLERSVQATNEWIHEIEQALSVDADTATQVLRLGLHAIRDSLGVDEAAHLGSQLPIVIRGLYYHQWDPSAQPDRRGRDERLAELGADPSLANHDVSPDAALDAVGQVLAARIDPGQTSDVADQAPDWVAAALR